jgi:hypothetical protein
MPATFVVFSNSSAWTSCVADIATTAAENDVIHFDLCCFIWEASMFQDGNIDSIQDFRFEQSCTPTRLQVAAG